MQGTVEATSDSRAHILDDQVYLLFDQFKDSPFERNLIMAFSRDYDLAQVILNGSIPKGQRHFAEGDVREFIARFNKQVLQVNFFVAKNAIIASGLPALALGDYELALNNVLREFSRCLGARLLVTQETPAPEVDKAPEPTTPPPPPPEPEIQELPPSLAKGLVDPLWSIIFPLPVLLAWLGNVRPWPLVGMALCTSVAFTMAHGQRRWLARCLACGLGNVLNLAVVAPVALCDWGTLRFPTLPYAGGIPPWVNASLWGLVCAMGTHLCTNVWLCLTYKPPAKHAAKPQRRGKA